MPTDFPDTGFTLDAERHEARFGGVRLDLDAAGVAVLRALLGANGATLAASTLAASTLAASTLVSSTHAAALARQDGAARLWACVASLNDALARCAPQAGHVAYFPGQGYRLVRAPAAAGRMLGRAQELARIAGLLQAFRFVTIAGPGGMGKTTLARAVAAQCADRYPDGVRFIDLATLAEGRELAGALGAALGIEHLTRAGLSRLAAWLHGKRMLVLFDCCEHHTTVAAHAGEALLRAGPGIDVLCTSREPLLAQGERIVRLGPMAVPAAAAAHDAATVVRYPAVALFLARANSDNPPGLVLDDRTAARVCQVCRAVDGVPLALELAAALVRPLGLARLARRTSAWLLDASPGQATPDQRHRTLSNMLDWSYDALAPHEQRVLRCLAVFRGGFTLEAAAAVAADPLLDADTALDTALHTVIELAAKSLVSLRADDGARARLLDLTRDYAYAKLAASGELDAVQERHARWLVALMDRLERDWMELPRGAWLDAYGPWVDDILAAIDWALGPGRQLLLGAQLAGVGFSLGDQAGVAREFQGRVRRALRSIGSLDDVPAAVLLRLNFVHADGPGLAATGLMKRMGNAEWVVQLARQSGSPMLQGAALIAIWGSPYVRGDYPAALAGAQRIVHAADAGTDRYLELIGQRTMAQSLHFMGRHAEAQQCAARALAGSGRRIPLAYQPSPVQVGTSVRIILARLLWMEGAADRALAMSEEALVLAEGDRPSALCQVLGMAAIPVALWRGETARAAGLTRRLRERAALLGLGFWIEWVQRLEDALAVIAGQADPDGLPFLSDRHDFLAKCRDHLVTFTPRLLTDEAVLRCETGRVAWCMPEVLRAQALRRLASGTPGTAGAEEAAAALLRRSLALAQQQGALAWSLRSATSLAALVRHQGQAGPARAILAPVLARCPEGRGTADLRAARALMASLE